MKFFKIEAEAGARKEEFVCISESRFTIKVREKAERNEANDRIRHLLAKHLGVPVKTIRIVTGHRSKHKLLAIRSNL